MPFGTKIAETQLIFNRFCWNLFYEFPWRYTRHRNHRIFEKYDIIIIIY